MTIGKKPHRHATSAARCIGLRRTSLFKTILLNATTTIKPIRILSAGPIKLTTTVKNHFAQVTSETAPKELRGCSLENLG